MTITPRKHLVVLSQYNFERDLNIRLLLSQFDEVQRFIVEEILNGSLQTTIKHLLQTVDISQEHLINLLKQLQDQDLLKIQGDKLSINKEMRKYFSFELEKFDPDFEPDLAHLQALLNKVPIHLLPQWYAISRTSDNIFESIVEKHFSTPRTYRKHIEELKADTPLIYKAYKEVLNTENFCLPVETFMERFNLDREQFEKFMLEFEYNLCGCLCFKPVGDQWKGYVTLMHEWKTYLNGLKINQAITLPQDAVEPADTNDFLFVEDLTKLIENIQDKVAPKKLEKLFPEYNTLLEALQDLYLLQSNDTIKAWLRKTKQEQANMVYQMLLSYTRVCPEKIGGCVEREFREICNSLKTVVHAGWIKFSDFMKNFHGIIGAQVPITLHKKGKKWRYALPEYSEKEKKLVETIIFEFLWKAGVVNVGKSGKAPCFIVTPHGRMTLGY
ncbi:MAG: hypothetical protein WC222_09375 [Parachlamydiales bacterium]